jgi:hypothetical protein
VWVKKNLADEGPIVGEADAGREAYQRRALQKAPVQRRAMARGVVQGLPDADRAEVDRAPRHPEPVSRCAAVVLAEKLGVRPVPRAAVAAVASPAAVGLAAGMRRDARAAEPGCRARRFGLGVRPLKARRERGEGVRATGDPEVLAGGLAAVRGVILRDVDERTVFLERHLVRRLGPRGPVLLVVVQRDDPPELPAM